MKKIEKLTDRQKSRFQEYINKWTDIGSDEFLKAAAEAAWAAAREEKHDYFADELLKLLRNSNSR